MNNHTDRSESVDHGKTGRPPLQLRAKITREAILEVSATLFSQTGYAGTSINDILAISETTKGAMYFHFSKKESIASEMLRRWSDAVSETVGKAATTGQPADRQVIMIYRELARRTQTEAITRAGLILSVSISRSAELAPPTKRGLTPSPRSLSTRSVAVPSTARKACRGWQIHSVSVSWAPCRLPLASTRTTPLPGEWTMYY